MFGIPSAVMAFITLLGFVVSALSGDAQANGRCPVEHGYAASATMQPTSNARVSTAFAGNRGQSQNVQLNDADWIDARNCNPGNGNSPPAFYRGPSQSPAPAPSQPLPGLTAMLPDNDTKMGIGAILMVLIIIGGVVISGLLRHIKENDTDKAAEELKVAKEAAFREKAIAISKGNHVPNV